jgi:hypothetical protein
LEHGDGKADLGKNGSYADNSHAHAEGAKVADPLHTLTDKANRFTRWAKGNGLALNAGKTQLLICGGGKCAAESLIVLNDKVVKPSETLELLGTRVDKRLTFCPHDKAVAAAARSRASTIAKLTQHLPLVEYLRQLASGLVVGKLSHAMAAVTTIRLTAKDIISDCAKATQVALNDVARSIVGCKRSDRVEIEELLESARIPSFNRLVATATAMEAWKSFHSTNGGSGRCNPVGELRFSRTITSSRSPRAATAGEIHVPLRGHTTLVRQSAVIWNRVPELRLASTLAEAKRAVKSFASGLPI